MERRALLVAVVTGTAGAAAGCVNPFFGVGSDCPRSFSLSLEPTTDAETAAAVAATGEDLHPVARDLLRRAAATDAVSFVAVDEPPLHESYARLDGVYYRVRTEVVSSREVTGYAFAFEASPDTATAATPGATVAFEDLPAPDRRAFLAGLGFPPPRKLRGANELSGDLTLAYPDADARAASVLVPDPQYEYVEYLGQYVRLDPTGARTVAVETTEVRLERLGTETAAFVDGVYEERGVDLDGAGLSSAARDVLDRAVEGEYDECADYDETTTYSAGLREVRRALARGGDGDRLADFARHEGTWYRVRASESVV
jgi:hypothetical protein